MFKVGDTVFLRNTPEDKWRVRSLIGHPLRQIECKNKKTGRLCIGNIDEFKKDGINEDVPEPDDPGTYGFYGTYGTPFGEDDVE